MKHKTMSSTIGALIILIISVAFATGCGKVPNKFIGSYTGTWEIANSPNKGSWTGTVDKEGIIIMNLTVDGEADSITMKGTVEKNGDVSASGSHTEASLALTGKIKDEKISGTIKVKINNPEGTVSGTFEGKKK